MTSSPFPRGPGHLKQKAVSVRLRGGQSVVGSIHIPDGLSLPQFLGAKKHFLNLTSVRPSDSPDEGESIGHLSLSLASVVWLIPEDGTLHVDSASVPAESTRSVEIELVDAVRLQVVLHIAEEQRMSDYLDSNWPFLPLWSARNPEAEQTIERLVINQRAVLSIREIADIG